MPYTHRIVYEESISLGDTVIFGDDVEENSSAISYTKIKEFIRLSSVNKSQKLRMSVDLKCTNPGNAYAKVYINGVAVGTEHWKNADAWETFTDDISLTNFKVGDAIQLYVYKSGAGATADVRNFRICGYIAGFRTV